MYLWPLKQLTIQSSLETDALYRILVHATDQENTGIYWGKKFYHAYWGRISAASFKIRPVVPYWNISPVDIAGRITPADNGKSVITMKMTCPFLRVVIPLVILAMLLFFISYGLQGNVPVFLTSSLWIVLVAYLLVNVPFQIQADRNVSDLINRFEGKVVQNA